MIQHNHIFQVKWKRAKYVVPDCPACASINPDRMTQEYAILTSLQQRALQEPEHWLPQSP